MCMNILSDGTPEGRWSVRYNDIAGGTFNSNSIKALPQCNQVNVSSISSSVYANLGAMESNAAMPPTSDRLIVTSSGSEVQTFTSRFTKATPAETSAPPSEPRSNRGDQIALGVGLGMVGVDTFGVLFSILSSSKFMYRDCPPLFSQLWHFMCSADDGRDEQV